MVGALAKAWLIRTDTGGGYKFLLNPHQIVDEYGAVYDYPEVQGVVYPQPVYKHGDVRKLTVPCRIICPPFDYGALATFTEFVRQAAMPNETGQPPVLWLGVGGLQLPIRIERWRVTYNDWTPELKAKDLEIEITAVVDYWTPVPPPPPVSQPELDRAKAYQQVRSQRRP